MNIQDLIYYQNNTNEISPEQYDRIKESVKKEGFLETNIFVRGDGVIISGNHRVRIARELGEGYALQLKIHNLGNMSELESFRLAELYNTRGETNETLRSITMYKLSKDTSVQELAHKFTYSVSSINRYIEIGNNLVEKYPFLIDEVDDKIITNLHLWYLIKMDKTNRIYSGELEESDKLTIIKKMIIWLKEEYKKIGKAVGVDRLQAEIRRILLIEFKKVLPELTDVPWASFWYPDKRIETIRHVIEDEVQLGTYSRELLKMTRNTRVSSFHLSIAFNLIRLLSRNYNKEEATQTFDKLKIIDPCCGMGIRIIAALMMDYEAYGYDISEETITKVKKAYPAYADNFFVHNSLEEIPTDADLVFVCPPYWNIEKYESIKGQLSNHKKYNQFLIDYEILIKNCVKVSKKWVVFVVANFRFSKKYYTLCYDTERLLKDQGLILYDKIILGHDLSKPTGGTKSIMNNHTRTAHDEMFIFKKGD